MLKSVWQHVRWFSTQVVQQFFGHDCMSNAGALTYTTLFAVVPMMTVTFTLFSLLPEFADIGVRLQSFVFENFVPVAGSVVQDKLLEFSERARDLTWIGFAVLIVTAFLMLVTIEKSLNTIWHVGTPRRGLQRFLLYWSVLSLSPLLIAAGFLISAYLASIPLISDLDVIGFGSAFIRFLPVTLSIVGFTVLYFAVPNTSVPLRHAIVGGVVTMSLLEFAKNAFAWAVNHMSIEPIYGTFAALPFFLIWLYLVWVIVLLGGIVVRTLGIRIQLDPDDNQPDLVKCVKVLEYLHDAHMSGFAVRDDEVNNHADLTHAQHERVFEVLRELNLVHQTDDERWALARNLRSVTLWELYAQMPDGVNDKALSRIPGGEPAIHRLTEFLERGSQQLSVSMDEVFAERGENAANKG